MSIERFRRGCAVAARGRLTFRFWKELPGMFRKLFQASSAGIEIADSDEESLDALAVNINRSQTREAEISPRTVGLGRFESFEEIYRSGPASQPSLAYDV